LKPLPMIPLGEPEQSPCPRRTIHALEIWRALSN
jgi:hypothetical protein